MIWRDMIRYSAAVATSLTTTEEDTLHFPLAYSSTYIARCGQFRSISHFLNAKFHFYRRLSTIQYTSAPQVRLGAVGHGSLSLSTFTLLI
jgi:hypothetical protein